MEQPVLQGPRLSLRENFLSETPPGAMRHFGHPELVQEIHEVPRQRWLKFARQSKEICVTPCDFSTLFCPPGKAPNQKSAVLPFYPILSNN